jgi:hypothetical protein
MTEEVQQNLAEVDSAPATEVTATPETVENAPVVADEQKESRVFTQEELDAAIGKRLAREQRKWEREQTQKQAEAQTLRAPAYIPPIDQFESPEAYADALAYKKAEELIAQRDQARQQSEILETYHEKEEEARSKYDDFQQVAYNPKLSITTVMAQSIQASEVGPEVAYYLGANPKEADRISRLAPILQAKEIGRIEAKMANDPPVKKTTSAPAPISPVTARSSGSPAYDTTDPRSTKTMTDSQWIEAERARQIKKLQAQAHR